MLKKDNARIVVQKYGGATLATPEKIKAIAMQVSKLSKSGHQVVAVVSAMGHTTNELIDLARKVSHHPSRRELDMLLTTGERVSMALLTMALIDDGCKAISFTGSQAGILTNESHVSAFIKDVQAFRVTDALKANKVVVLAGFQGVSPQTKEITTLGRGGTDTTAVAMAAYLNADICEILKDVPCIFTADPKIISKAKAINTLSYDQLLEMTYWGAKVLHYRSVELAKKKNVSLYIGPAHGQNKKNKLGTFVKKETPMYESSQVIAINSHSEVLQMSVKQSSPAKALRIINNFFDKNEIAHPQILNFVVDAPEVVFFLTGPREILQSIKQSIKTEKLISLSKTEISAVSATCAGASSNEGLSKILIALEKDKIKVTRFFQSAMSSVVFVGKKQKDLAIKALHKLIV